MCVKILGTYWEIRVKKDLQDAEGLCDYKMKIIYLKDFSKETIYHELIHAYLYEAGLRGECSWAGDEVAVDWYANMMEKIMSSARIVEVLVENKDIVREDWEKRGERR